MTRDLRRRIAMVMLRSGPRAIQHYLLLTYLTVLLSVTAYGWSEARFSGVVTAIVCVSLFIQLALFALGYARESRPQTTLIGRLQRQFAWPYIIAAGAGAYYGGWKGGWLYTLLATLVVALVFMVVLWVLTRNEKRKRRGEALDALRTALLHVEDVSSVEPLPDEVANAFGLLLDACESEQRIAAVMARRGVTRRELREVFQTLLIQGGRHTVDGYPVAALAFATASTLDYLLSSPPSSPAQKLQDVERFLRGEPLVWVSGATTTSSEAESRLAAPFLDTSATGTTVMDASAAVSAASAPTRKRSFLLRTVSGLRWAYLRRQLPVLAGDGRFAELLEMAQEATAVARDGLGQDDVRTLLFLALAQKEHGDYAVALATARLAQRISDREWKLFENVRRVASLEHGRRLLDLADCLRQVASIQLAMGDFPGALQEAERALELLEQQRTHTVIDPDAHVMRERSVIECLELVGDVRMAQGDFARAEPAYRGALAAREKLFGPGHVEMALGYMRLGSLLDEHGQFDVAAGLHAAAVGNLEGLPAFGEAHLPRALLARAAHRQNVGDFDGAEEDLVRTLDLLRQCGRGGSPDSIQAHVCLGMVFAAKRRPEAALESFTRALDRLDSFTTQVFAVSSERQRALYLSSVMAYVEIFASFVQQFLPRDARAVDTLSRLLFKYKAIGPELLARQRESVLFKRHPEYADKLAKLARLRAAIAEIELARRKESTASSVLPRLRVARERLEQDLAAVLPDVRELSAPTSSSPGIVLPAGSALIDLFRGRTCNFAAVPSRGQQRMGPARYVACVLRHGLDDSVRLVELGDAASIDTLIATFRASIIGDDGPRDDDDRDTVLSRATVRADRPVLHDALSATMRDLAAIANPVRQGGDAEGEALARAVLNPLLEAAGECRRLFIAPDGDLLRLPFEVLPIAPGRPFLDDDMWRMSYLSAGRDVLRFAKGPLETVAPALVVAAPEFDLGAVVGSASRGVPFSPLAGTKDEGERVSALLGVQPLLGEKALEGAVKTCRSPRVLHIATHGFVLRDHRRSRAASQLPAAPGVNHEDVAGLGLIDNPLLRSGLALAGANSWLAGAPLPQDAEDGLLTAEDVSAMDLSRTELAVLSACSTGLGESQFSEGVLGLRRAFVLAGANTLVMSLWKVPDAATAELMTAFYELLLADTPRAEALHEAQRQLRQRYPDPFVWGAFICQGDPRVLKLKAQAPESLSVTP